MILELDHNLIAISKYNCNNESLSIINLGHNKRSTLINIMINFC